MFHAKSCDQVCNSFGDVYNCSCLDGYYLDPHDNQTCLDINECAQNESACEQLCVNTVGSYFCACQSGYTLTSDDRTCTKRTKSISCPCSCNFYSRMMSVTSQAAMQEMLAIRKALTVSKTGLSSYVSLKTSAADKRDSSQTVGYVGMAIIAIVTSLIIIQDVLTVCRILLSHRHTSENYKKR
uniref:EGF-like domain-containing protein n=1 Tax=Biomphalaria glabrata TaxID=6526 RepID=A0A2C9M0J0_BIOGL